jgi:hypothetical protein
MRTRRFIALIAAYAIALQAILPLAAVLVYAADPSICAGFQPVNQPAAPHSSDQCCVIACGFSCASALPGSHVVDIGFVPARGAAILPASVAVLIAPAYQQTPQSRAPPAS